MQHLTDETLDGYVGRGYTAVDFWAAWCAPCRPFARVFEEASYALEGRVKFAKAQVEDNLVHALMADVTALPTVLLYKDGALVDRLVGTEAVEELVAFVEKNIAG